MNRQQRRMAKKVFGKKFMMENFDKLEIEDIAAAKRMFKSKPNFQAFFKNQILSVQIYHMHKGIRLAGIRRHDEKPSIPWSFKQKVKNELFGEESVAIEVFPKESELVDQANINWIWILDPEMDFSFSNTFSLNEYIRSV